MGTVRRVSRNVKRWRNAAMALRWTAAGMMEAIKGFRRLKARKYLPLLRTALAAHQSKCSPNELIATLMPHSITDGERCLVYFNKIWGIPTDSQSALFGPGPPTTAVTTERKLRKRVRRAHDSWLVHAWRQR